MTLHEFENRMGHGEWILQMAYDRIAREAQQERAMDAQLSADHMALVQRMKGR